MSNEDKATSKVLDYREKIRALQQILHDMLLDPVFIDPAAVEAAADTALNLRQKLVDLKLELEENQVVWSHAQGLPLPGEYYTTKTRRFLYRENKEHISYPIIKVKLVNDYRNGGCNPTYPDLRFRSEIQCVQMRVDGLESETRHHFNFDQWFESLHKGTVGPVEWALIGEKDVTAEDIERVKPLIPFIQIGEGKNLSLDLLRRLVKNARTQAQKEDKR